MDKYSLFNLELLGGNSKEYKKMTILEEKCTI
jgi:hypothetical protein